MFFFFFQFLCGFLILWWLQMWPDLIQKAKDGGVDVIQTYVFWNGHEPSPGNVMQIPFCSGFCVCCAFFLFFLFFYHFKFLTRLIFTLWGTKKFSIILRTGMIWLSSSSWFNKQAFIFICGLAPIFVLNGTLGNYS